MVEGNKKWARKQVRPSEGTRDRIIHEQMLSCGIELRGRFSKNERCLELRKNCKSQ